MDSAAWLTPPVQLTGSRAFTCDGFTEAQCAWYMHRWHFCATATKTNWITMLTGVSHERLQVFHRWIAYAFLILALMHTFPFIVYHIRFHDMQMHFKMSLLFYWTGIVALIFQAWLTFASHSAIRKLLGYEFFKATHFAAVVIFMITFFWHCDYTLTSWHYFIGTAAVYVPCYVYPWLRTCFEYGVRKKAHIKVEDNGFVRVTIPANFTWEIGQHCFLRFTGFGLTQALSAHPFTICSLPSSSPDGQSFLVFYLKKHRGFTAKLYEHALQNPEAQISVLVDGPYGGINTQRFVNSNHLVVIAGGSGAGWTLPFIEQYIAAQTGQADEDCKEGPRERCPFSSLRVILASRDVESCSCLTGPIESVAFLRIPPEIIVAIVSEVLAIGDNFEAQLRGENSERLKVLRLTHRKFADCSYLNKLLFTNIHLEPTRTSLRRGNFSRVVGYTRSITFEAYASWKLVPPRNVGMWSHTSLRPIIAAHDAYINDALETQRLLEDPDGDLIETWTNILKMVGSRLEKVTIANNTDYKNLYLQDPDPTRDWKTFCFRVPDTEIEPHEGMTRRSRDEDDKKNAEYAKGYACAILQALRFQASPPNYSFWDMRSALSPAWRELDLSKLKHLKLDLLYPYVPYRLSERTSMAAFLHNKQSYIQKKHGNIAHDLIDKCHSTVETLSLRDSIDGGLEVVWPTRAATYELPALREFDQAMESRPRLLHDWLLRMKNLRSFMIWGGLDGKRSANWRHVLDAIRDHPNVSGPDPKGLRFLFPGDTDYEGVVCKDSSIASPREVPYAEYSLYPLEAHLYGEIEYSRNAALREELGDYGHGDEDSDEEDEDNGMEGENSDREEE
ncbi:hypothetical protein FPRO04_10375 [Fusarium proliferatum]|nr:hypothetical protein FPRO04_10375 [Fusarium proliferatum]